MNNTKTISRVVGGVIALILVVIFLSFAGQFFYILEKVDAQEVGIQFSSGRIKKIVGPGVYSDFGLFVEMVRVSSQSIPFSVEDQEIITKDKQRMGVVVSGDIFRPSELDKDVLREKWSQYRGIFTDDAIAVARVQDFARQAMKVCVGMRTFDDNTLGVARDELRACIDSELNDLSQAVGLTAKNVVVPEIILSPEVQAGLDAIVQSRLATEKAAQDELKAKAEAAAEQARVEGEIRVEQSRIQETTRQQTTLAALEQERVKAQLEVIEAERTNKLAQLETERQEIEARKANEILTAQRDLEIRELEMQAMKIKAQGDIAFQEALAMLYAENPEFVSVVIAQANASALTQTDKVIFTLEGMVPNLVMSGPGIVPTVDTTSGVVTPE
ncbi:MAG: hypothetical protein JXA33_02865 [Anaerolineae bacterium]|nr:hypothetical protein [Anaerolineae bacterium]